jgi:hypothetical protein
VELVVLVDQVEVEMVEDQVLQLVVQLTLEEVEVEQQIFQVYQLQKQAVQES